MTPRTFFTIFLKIMGVYLVLEALSVIPQLASTASYLSNDVGAAEVAFNIVLILLGTTVYMTVIYSLLFKNDWLINKLSLDKNFQQEKFEINLHRSAVLSIAVIVIGGLIFIDALPFFCRQVFLFIQERSRMYLTGVRPSNGWMIFYFVKAFIGFLMMIYQRHIVNFIEVLRKRKAKGLLNA